MPITPEMLQRMKAGDMKPPMRSEGGADAASDSTDGMALIAEIEERLAKLKRLYGGAQDAEV